MEISVLLTIFLMIISLGGLFLQAGKICLIEESQINDASTIKQGRRNSLYGWAVKFIFRILYLLNTVITILFQKMDQTLLIKAQNLKHEG